MDASDAGDENLEIHVTACLIVLFDCAVDASDAGDGNLEIHVTADGESVPNYVRQERDANFRVTFTPQRPTRHKVNAT